MADSWIITAPERYKHNEQFKAIGPNNGFISGEQAKGLFMQSTLPPQVLGIIWMLSDMDGDGKMNQNEFSIACKLINMKLRGFSLPQTLPPAMKESAVSGGIAPAAVPIVSATVTMPNLIPQATPVSQQLTHAGLINPPMAVSSAPVSGQLPLIPLDQSIASDIPRRPSLDSGSGSIPGDWGIPQQSKLKFTQVFNMSDRAKSGFLSGVQARNILIQSQLPHQALAQIWALSDVDNDGRLSCEEFVLAMYLCEQAKAGHAVPTLLPPELIPPTLRRSRTSSIQSVGSIGTPLEGPLSPTSAMLLNDTSFEDRRRENYEKGQAELERRRKTLLDAQRRETEERLRREREEESKREKIRQEAERKRQEELEVEMQRQKEVESQKDAERKRIEETKEQARKDAERQRQEEWEKQRLQELTNVRQRQQENLLTLKAKNQSLTIDLTTKENEVKNMTEKISNTRVAVTEVKATIDGMRSTRDTHMANMNELKDQARDQNQRLLNLNQEKARLKARSLASSGIAGSENNGVDASVANKQLIINQLQEKLDEITVEMTSKEQDVNNNGMELDTLKDQMRLTGKRCEQLYTEFAGKRDEVLALREKLLNPDAAWGDIGSTVQPTDEAEETGQRFEAIHQFDSRSHDELSFMPGDIIVVLASTGAEDGWLSGKLNDQTGWFPEAYCTPYEDGIVTTEPEPAPEPLAPEPLAPEPPAPEPPASVISTISHQESVASLKTEIVPESITDTITSGFRELGRAVSMFNWRGAQENQLALTKGSKIIVREELDTWYFGDANGASGWFPKSYVRMDSTSVQTPDQVPIISELPECLQHNEPSVYYETIYPYQSSEPGDLIFEGGETVLVVKKEGDWWQGLIVDRLGVFPCNYLNPDPLTLPVTEEEEVDYTSSEAPPIPVLEEVEERPFAEILAEKLKRAPTLEGKTSKKLDVAQVIAPYDATTPNQLSLVRGQIVSVRKKTDSGWWEGELHAKGKKKEIGWFPASYVKVMCGSNRTTPVSMEMMGRDDELPFDFPPDTTKVIINKEVVAEPKPSQSTFERVVALYPYAAINEDELTFEPGDEIMVLDKEDSAWWKGSLRGQIGVFPSNYVIAKSIGLPAANVTSPDAGESLC